jgi:hypothetical protein
VSQNIPLNILFASGGWCGSIFRELDFYQKRKQTRRRIYAVGERRECGAAGLEDNVHQSVGFVVIEESGAVR